MVNTDQQKIQEVLTRGVETVLPTREAFATLLSSGKRLRFYHGMDPTAPFLHLGHSLQLRKLRQFQDLGHEVILLLGSFTAMIGDPTDKMAARKQLTKEEVLANAKTYKKQASKFLRFTGENAAKIVFNHKWLSKLNFEDIINLASNFTVQQMMERDMFVKRFFGAVHCPSCNATMPDKSMNGGAYGSDGRPVLYGFACPKCGKQFNRSEAVIDAPKPIHLHEFMYPLMQGYDSVVLDVDAETGGNDQVFNMLAGRTLLKSMKNKEKFVVALKLLTNDEGKKMSKSEGGFIAMTDSPEDVYGKIMAMNDSMIVPYFELATDVPMSEVAEVRAAKESGANPRDLKMRLARTVVTMFHNATAAKRAEKHFVGVFQKKETPDEMPEFRVAEAMTLADLLVATKLAESKGEARRLVEQGGIALDDAKLGDAFQSMTAGTTGVLRRGKRQFVRLIP